MPEREKVIAVVREWTAKAENDLKNASHSLKLGEDCPTDTVCFHAQQCVEKYLKAVLVLVGVDFPKTHDIEQIMALLPDRSFVSMSIEQQRQLMRYATVARYPGSPDISLAEARQAVTIARRVRSAVRKYIPKDILKHE